MSKYTALHDYVEYVKPAVSTIRHHYNEFAHLSYSLINAEDIFVQDKAERLLGLRQGAHELSSVSVEENPSGSGYIPLIYARYGEETGACVALQLTPTQFALLSKEVKTAMFGKNPRHAFKEPVYVIMEHRYFATVSGFKAHRTTNMLHDPLDYVTEKFGLSYLDTELDHYLCDICFEAALENEYV
jgi:hypothetical protein